MEDFIVAWNPDEDSALPYLVRLRLGPNGVVLKVRDTWPRTAKVCCHPSSDWNDALPVVDRRAERAGPARNGATGRARPVTSASPGST